MRTPPRTRTLRRTSDAIHLRRFAVEVVVGPDRGLSIGLESEELSIGTAPASCVKLTDGAVSRHHATIVVQEGGLLLKDLGSTNGTHLAGHRVREAWLDDGSRFVVGESELRVRLLDDELSQPVSALTVYGDVVAESAAMRRVFDILGRVERVDTILLLEGETGTGKSALAEAVHKRGHRADAPFVVVDCGAISRTLIESELFGHVRGSFTGAIADRQGAFESAVGGTVFLDEIGELPLDLQPALLRVLERRQIKRVGQDRPLEVDVRVMAATNCDLRRAVNEGRFREDLLYRLDAIRVVLPPLRERPEDLLLLASHFYREAKGDPAAVPPADFLARVARQRWPGNARELKGAVTRLVLLGDRAHEANSEPADELGGSYREAKERAVRHWEADYVLRLLDRYRGNLSRAARAVNMDRNHLRKLRDVALATLRVPVRSPG